MAQSDNKLKLKEKDEAKLLAWCEKQYDKCRRQRLAFERQWYLNIAFYFGKQWVQWTNNQSTQLNKLYEPKAPPWRVRLVSNRIRPIIRNELAKITKEEPTAYVIPASSDDDDLFAARAAEAAYEHLYRTLNVPLLMRRAGFWVVTCGTGFLKDWWDKSAMDGDTPGKIAVEPISPFHILVPDLQEEELEYQPFVIHAMAKTPDSVEMIYDKKLQPDTSATADVLEQRFLSAMGVNDSSKDFVSVKEMWVKPCQKFPQGALITWAGGEILYMEEGWAYDHGEYPFTKISHVPAGRFYGDSAIVDLIPLQKEFNRTRSQLIEAKNRMAKPQLIAQRGSIDSNKMTTEPGLIIEYQPGYQPPQPLPLTAIPNYVIGELERCLVDMDDISGQHEVSRGQTPPGVSAATAISFLSEQDDTKISHTVHSVEDATERVGRHFLSHVIQYWQAKRAIRVMGDNNMWETLMLSQSDLRGNYDLKVEPGSAMPQSRAAKQAFITELGKMQWINGQQAMRYLGMAETNRLYEDMTVDYRQAQRENVKMTKGVECQVNDWDNHVAHIEEHNNFRKKQQFENLPDEVKVLYQQHVLLHQSAMGMAQGTPVLPGEKPPGAPGGPPGPLPGPGAPLGAPPGGPPPPGGGGIPGGGPPGP